MGKQKNCRDVVRRVALSRELTPLGRKLVPLSQEQRI